MAAEEWRCLSTQSGQRVWPSTLDLPQSRQRPRDARSALNNACLCRCFSLYASLRTLLGCRPAPWLACSATSFRTTSICQWHQFQVLTKRAHRMAYFLDKQGISVPENVWLGVSAENQEMAASRLPALLDIRVAVRFVSAEPLLGPVDLTPWLPGLAWVIVGGESGMRRRPMDYDWARRIRDNCQAAAVHFFYKQGNARRPGQDRVLDGTTHDALPRQLPPERSEYAGAVR